jgi:hypothetical protein
MELGDQAAPRARDEGLVVQELPDELLVYDLERHRSHCLNHAAALVWRHCDGKKTVREIAASLQRDLDQPFDEDMVWLALNRLQRANLLQKPSAPLKVGPFSSRRALLRKMAVVGGSVLVASIPVPAAHAAAASAGGVGAECQKNKDCAGNLHCCLRPNGAPTCDADNCGSGTCPLGCVSG